MEVNSSSQEFFSVHPAAASGQGQPMSHWSTRLVAEMKARRLTAATLGDASGVAEQNIYKFMQGKVDQPRGDALDRLAEALHISVEWLRTGSGNKSLDEEPGNCDEIASSLMNRDPSTNVIVPELSPQLQMGDGAVVDREYWRGSWSIMRNYLSTLVSVTHPDNVVIVEVQGDSMEPTLRSRDRVMVDRGDSQMVPGQIYAVRDELTDTVMVKRLTWAPNTGDDDRPRIRIVSDNSTEASFERPIDAILIIGRVVWYARPL